MLAPKTHHYFLPSFCATVHGNNESMVRLETILGSWKAIREDTAQAVKDVPAGAMDYRRALMGRSSAFAVRNESFLADEITRFDGQRITRLEMLQSLKEHELTHSAQ